MTWTDDEERAAKAIFEALYDIAWEGELVQEYGDGYRRIARAALAAVSAGPEPAEYQEWAARERLDGEVYTFRDERTARRFVAAVDHPDAPVELIRRTLGEWEPVDV